MPKDLEIPRFGLPADRLLGWQLEAIQEGDAWLRAQKTTRDWGAVLDLLSSTSGTETDIRGMSNTGYNKSKRIARELVASLANFRHEGEYRVLWDQQLYDQAHTFTLLDRNLYRLPQIHAAFRSALQYGVGKGTTYLYETWASHFYGSNRGEIKLQALDPANVTFVQLPMDHDIQDAYCVIIREELPINLAKARYAGTNPTFAAMLKPDREAPGLLARGLQKVQQFISPALRVGGRMGGRQDQASWPVVDIFHIYTRDDTHNDGPFSLQMGPFDAKGQPAANWSYTVPALNDPLPTGLVNTATGNEFTRPATRDDTKLFPFRRYTILARTGVCWDGPSMWWHGQVPLARLSFNDWAWEPLGASLIGELRTMQIGIESLMRLIEDSSAARLNPARIYDDRLVSKSWAQAFNPRMAGAVAAAPLSEGEPIKFPVDAHYYDVPPFIPDWIRQQEDRMDYQSGARDLVAVAKAQQIPSADTLEKLMEMAGPIVQDLVRRVEQPLAQLGYWRLAYYMQFYTTERMLATTGPDGGTTGQIQFVPDMIRASVPLHGALTPEAYRKRQIRMLEHFHYHVSESGINEIHRMSTKLFYLQLMKEGFPISPWTFARIAQIPNFGPEPEGTNTEMERYIAWRRMQIELEAEVQVAGQQALAAAGGVLPGGTPGNAPGEGGGGEGEGPEGEGKGPGRPQSYQKAPRIEQKDGGTRSTVATS